jgi:hypothetical protein
MAVVPLYFFPDSVDTIDPEYDLTREAYSPHRVRQRREAYAHEALHLPPYDGVLVSMAMAGFRAGAAGRAPSRYTEAQRYRLFYSGVHRFLRLDDSTRSRRLLAMGDTGAYAYAYDEDPPITAVDALDFYDGAGFDLGLSPDHLVPGFLPAGDVPPDWCRRRAASLDLARSFLDEHHRRGSPLVPIGVAQGWSADSYAASVRDLQRMGYDYVALGGLAPLGTASILKCLEAVGRVRKPSTRLHLLGLARPECLALSVRLGVASFDTTTPLRQAFKDDKNNYHTPEGHYLAVRVPSWEGNPRLERRVRESGIARSDARSLEQASLGTLRRYGDRQASLSDVLESVRAYEVLFNGRDQTEAYAHLLADRPWERCPCKICRSIGIEVVFFRGAERNRRRGFHNLHVFHQSLAQATATTA